MRSPQSRFFSGVTRLFACLILIFCTQFDLSAQDDGKALFMTNCAQCHNPIKDATGPALQGAEGRVPSKDWLYRWIRNSAGVIASGDQYANEIYNKWNKTAMTAFPNLSDGEIDAILTYVETYTPPKPPGDSDGAGSANASSNGAGNSVLYAILTIVLLLAAFILSQVNKMLNRDANRKAGVPNKKEIPFYKNKVYIALAAVIGFIALGIWLSRGGIDMGREQNYMPEQPIFYSHKVHAGINQINCQYCHSGASKSKHAMIPSTNVCMNCHKQIDEYSGVEEYALKSYEGKDINGTKEIQKLYSYAGWDPTTKKYKKDAEGNVQAKPVDWVKVHNLPDHVYFNHSTHVVNGNIACQRCHGPIQEMDEVYQFADLSMGWCINCHRETDVQFANNDYYSIYEKYHEELKDGDRESVKVSDIGGLECQKCHY